MTQDPVWISVAGALAVHSEQLAEHGGGEGVRDLGLLESALDRPRNLLAYGDPDMAHLAASYAHRIARNHPFIDGNKRTALVVSEGFLALNGHALDTTDGEIVAIFLALAAGELSEEALAEWFRARIVSA